jgi:hypothetical protein
MLIQKIHKEAILHKEKLDSETKSQSIHPKNSSNKDQIPRNPFQKTMEL